MRTSKRSQRPVGLVALVIAVAMALPQGASALGVAGGVDPTFNGGAPVLFDLAKTVPRDTYFWEAAVDGSGRIVGAGFATDANGRHALALARLGTNGAPDPSFGTGGGTVIQLGTGKNPYSDPKSLFSIPGRYMGVALFRNNNERFDQSVYAFGEGGGPELGYGNGSAGLATKDPRAGWEASTSAATAGPDGSTFVSGPINQEGKDLTGASISKFTPAGQPASGFGAENGSWIRGLVPGQSKTYGGPVAVLPGNRLLMAGSATHGDGSSGTDLVMTRLSSVTAAFDESFGSTEPGITVMDVSAPGLKERRAVSNALTIGPSGEIYVAGDALDSEENSAVFVARFTPSGAPDPSFGQGGLVRYQLGGAEEDSAASDIDLQADGRIVVLASVGAQVGGRRYSRILRLREDGSLDPTFGGGGMVIPSFGGERSGVTSLTLAGDRLVASGYLEEGAKSYGLITRLLTGPLPDPVPGGEPSQKKGALKLRARRLGVDRKGRVSIPLLCSADGPCAGKLALVSATGKASISARKKGPKKAKTLAKRSYSLAAGAKTSLVLKVNGKARTKARSKAGLAARLAVLPAGGKLELSAVSLYRR